MNNTFKKSSFCATSTCVEVKIDLTDPDTGVLLRDSDGDYVCYSVEEWRAFIAGVKNGEFDI